MELIAGKSGDNVNLIVKDFNNKLEYDFHQSEIEGLARNSIDVAITALNTLDKDTEFVEDVLYKIQDYLLEPDKLAAGIFDVVKMFLESSPQYSELTEKEAKIAVMLHLFLQSC